MAESFNHLQNGGSGGGADPAGPGNGSARRPARRTFGSGLRAFLKILLALFVAGLVAVGAFAAWLFWPVAPLPEGAVIDRLVVHKSERRMHAYEGGRLLRSYRISLGFQPEGHKQFQGDGRTPEGRYRINDRNPNSVCYKNLGISYPNEQDRAYARSRGRSPGGDIKIHGLPNGAPRWGRLHRFYDWTHGCIAVTNEEMEQLYHQVANGALIEILP